MNSNMPMMGGHHHKKVLGALIVLFGLDFLLGALGVLTPMAVAIIWPILVICLGIKMLMKCKCSQCETK